MTTTARERFEAWWEPHTQRPANYTYDMECVHAFASWQAAEVAMAERAAKFVTDNEHAPALWVAAQIRENLVP